MKESSSVQHLLISCRRSSSYCSTLHVTALQAEQSWSSAGPSTVILSFKLQ